MELGDVNDLVDMAVALRRAVPAERWVTESIYQADLNSFKGLF